MRRKLITAAAIASFCLGVVAMRAVLEGRSALADGDDAAARGDFAEAIAKWRRAARWYLPLAPHVGGAYDRLEHLAREAEAKGDVTTALAAWRGIRGSILATRSFYTPQSHRLDPANQKIAALMAGLEGDRADPGATPAERQAWHYALLIQDPSPSVFWSIVALLGFGLWIGGAFWFALRGVSDQDGLVRRTAASSGACVAAGLVIWLLGLYKA